MNFISLLIVEDDEKEQKSWSNVIEMFNATVEEQGYSIRIDMATTAENAIELLSSRRYDAAVVDIRLKQTGGHSGPNTDGNMVLATILDSEMAIVALFTGEVGLAEPPAWAGRIVRTFTKGGGEGEGTPAVMKWLSEQVPMILHIKAAQERIRHEMARIFTRSIWPRWKNWVESAPGTNESNELAITRHITSHVYASLLSTKQHGVHPEEWYFVPPLFDTIMTGDIVRNSDNSVEVVITPRCDFSRDDKNETIQLASCKDISEEWNKRCDKISTAKMNIAVNPKGGDAGKLDEKLINANDSLRRYAQHNSNSSVFHFLPRMITVDGTSIGPFFVQFDKIRFVPRDSVEAKVTLPSCRIASITSEFLPSLVERLGSFFSRIGTPDYSHPE